MIARAGHREGSGLYDGLIVDLFAGGGGASYGIERAMGRAVDVAVNHDPFAVAMHRINHPRTYHWTCDVWEVDPVKATGGRPVDLLWASPDCTHHSKARGCKPIREAGKKSRALPWVVIRWARYVRPRVILMENVEEFADWGPVEGDKACPLRLGQSFEAFKTWLGRFGYEVDHRELRACEFGVPTIRKRLYLIARCDGRPIVWLEVTHGQVSTNGATGVANISMRSRERVRVNQVRGHNRADDLSAVRPGSIGDGRRRSRTQPPQGGSTTDLKPYRTAAECIDWSIPCPSIFMTPIESQLYYEATGTRVVRPLADKTMRRIAAGLKRYVLEAAEPFIVNLTHGVRVEPTDEPMRSVTGANRGERAVVAPYLVPRYGEREGQRDRARRVDEPSPTVTPTGNGGSLIAPVLIGAGGATGSGRPRRADRPGKSILPNDRRALVAAFIAKHFGGVVGADARTPLGTTTSKGCQNQVVAAHLIQQRGSNRGNGGDVRDPLCTVTAGGNHAGLVASFLTPFYGNVGGASPGEPLQTITTKDRHALVTVMLDGEPYVIVDIGMRMLTPRELYRAQGFGDEYVIDRGVDADGAVIALNKTQQVRCVGNSVCPELARLLTLANVVNAEAEAVA